MRILDLLLITTLTLSPFGCTKDSSTSAPVASLADGASGSATAVSMVATNSAENLAAGGGAAKTAALSGDTNAAAGSGAASVAGLGAAGSGGWSLALASGGASADPGAAGAASNAATYLGLAPIDPAQGFQVRSLGADIPSGQEVEYCEVAQLPGAAGDVYWVNEYELANGVGSHHLLVSVLDPGGPAEQKAKQLKIGDHVTCVAAQTAFGEVGITTLGGAQKPYDRVTMPDGVGSKYYGGQYLIFDYHFLNATPDTIHALSAVNFHTTRADDVKHAAHAFSFFNYTIDTPAHSSKSFTGECRMKQDVMVGSLGRHTHRYGKDFDVWYAGGAHDGEQVWASKDWEEDTQYKFPAPFVMHAGEGFRFRCSYDNPNTTPLRFGIRTTDEMCILAATIWEAHDAEDIETGQCDIIWTDDKGIGHPADEAGGVPPASILTAGTCAVFNGTDTECKTCTCSACGNASMACALDTDCSAVLTCLSGCVEGEDCLRKCETVTNAHSSAIGLLRQAQLCLKDKCKTCKVD